MHYFDHTSLLIQTKVAKYILLNTCTCILKTRNIIYLKSSLMWKEVLRLHACIIRCVLIFFNHQKEILRILGFLGLNRFTCSEKGVGVWGRGGWATPC